MICLVATAYAFGRLTNIILTVYDVHEFLHEVGCIGFRSLHVLPLLTRVQHPGGDLVLVGEAGKDATKAFEDVQHTDEAKELMEEYLVGYCSEVRASRTNYKGLSITNTSALLTLGRPSKLLKLVP